MFFHSLYCKQYGPVVLLPFWGYSLCLLNLGINPNKNLRLEKKSPKFGNTGLIWIGKQPLFGCKVGKINSLWTHSDGSLRSSLIRVHSVCFHSEFSGVHLNMHIRSTKQTTFSGPRFKKLFFIFHSQSNRA